MTETVSEYEFKSRIPAEPNGCEVIIHFGDREVYRVKVDQSNLTHVMSNFNYLVFQYHKNPSTQSLWKAQVTIISEPICINTHVFDGNKFFQTLNKYAEGRA